MIRMVMDQLDQDEGINDDVIDSILKNMRGEMIQVSSIRQAL